MYRGKTITVLIPCLNEEEGIRSVIAATPDWVDHILVVDNGSTDNTVAIAQKLGATVIHESRKGYGRAYRTGFSQVQGEIVCCMDGDHTYPMADLERLLEVFFEVNVDFLSCCRFPIMNPEAMSFKHWIGNKLLSFAMALLFQTPIEDSQSGMWVFNRRILDHVRLTSDGMPLSEEIKLEVIRHPQLTFKEEHIKYSARKGEIKLQPYRDGMRNLWFLIVKRFFG